MHFYRQVVLATQIVDQIHAETAQLRDRQETESILPKRHIHEQGFRADGCTWQWAKQQGPGLFELWDQSCLLKLFKS